MKTEKSEEIRVYVADLAAYNNGFLHGVWVNATQELEGMQEQVSEMLQASSCEEKAEEYAIHDYEGFGAYSISEYEGLESVHEVGCYSSLADYAEELTTDTSEIPKHLEFYIDYERMGRDMEMSGGIFTVETGCQEVHVFLAD